MKKRLLELMGWFFCFILIGWEWAFTASAAEIPGAPEAASIAGSLPYSHQWTYSRSRSRLYASVGSQALPSSRLRFGHLVSDLGSARVTLGGVDYFAEAASWGEDARRGVPAPWGIWLRYGLAAGGGSGALSDDRIGLGSASESSFLTLLGLRAGPLLVWRPLSFFEPFVGLELHPFAYRHSSSLGGAEAQGVELAYGAVAGAHWPLLFSGHLSLLTEIHHERGFDTGATMIAPSTFVQAALGYSL